MSISPAPKLNRGPTPDRDKPLPPPELPGWYPITRGVALFLGLFLLLQVWNELVSPSVSTNWWWIDLRPLRPYAARGLLALHGSLLLLFACSASEPKPIRSLGWVFTAMLFAVALFNTVQWYGQLASGAIHSPVRIPFVLQTAAFLSVALAGLSRAPLDRTVPSGGLLLGVLTFDVCLVLFPLAQIFCAGPVDDRREADVFVIAVPNHSSDKDRAADLQRCLEVLSRQPSLKVCLIGAGKGYEEWLGELIEASGLEPNQFQQVAPPQSATEGQNFLRKLAAEGKWTSVLLCAESIDLPRWRVDASRAGLDSSQIPLRDEVPGDWVRIVREVPSLWLVQINGRPTASIK